MRQNPGADVLDAYAAMMEAASAIGVNEVTVKGNLRTLIANSKDGGAFVQHALARHLAK